MQAMESIRKFAAFPEPLDIISLEIDTSINVEIKHTHILLQHRHQEYVAPLNSRHRSMCSKFNWHNRIDDAAYKKAHRHILPITVE